jgi:Holliday junction resolvase RusA-like endonuclease
MKYTIPRTPPSLNKYAGRENVWDYREQKALWKQLCNVYCRPRPKEPPRFALVILTFYFKDKRRRDADNYQKMILDGLVGAGIIQDDDFEHCMVLCKGGYDKGNERTEIEIREVEKEGEISG